MALYKDGILAIPTQFFGTPWNYHVSLSVIWCASLQYSNAGMLCGLSFCHSSL